jgi:hypothetical protein
VHTALLALNNTCKYKRLRGCSSVVERQLPKLNVVGSIPSTRFDVRHWLFHANLFTAHPADTGPCFLNHWIIQILMGHEAKGRLALRETEHAL